MEVVACRMLNDMPNFRLYYQESAVFECAHHFSKNHPSISNCKYIEQTVCVRL